MSLRLALLWHMHQPCYVSPVTGETTMPWVRLHATHAYYDMARVLERHPSARVTVNFVPSLVEQLEAAIRGTAKERYLEASRQRAEEMDGPTRRFVVDRFFMASRERAVLPVPRYAELLNKRAAGADTFTPADLRDLQVHFNLAWMGYWARRDEPEVARLAAKGRDYTFEDLSVLLTVQQRLVGQILPRWRALARRGQIELSTTPYFHPILPLLIDSDSARRAMPEAKLPPRFQRADDARWQVRTAREKHAEIFGQPPLGMWPAEGSISPEALALFAEEGVRWVATDEGVLQRSQPAPGHAGQLYRPYRFTHGPHSLAVLFRDRALSDRIGFTYARLPAAEAVADFRQRLTEVAQQAQAGGVERPVVSVILDGENAWEHYPSHGGPFLDALYAALSQDSDISLVTMSQAAAGPAATLQQWHSGSWIDANYRIWIGHPEDNRAWELLGQARALLEKHMRAKDVDPRTLQQARRLLLAAEGSDWFWWYGDDFETDNAAAFDLLFREHLIQACRLMGEQPPVRLESPISARAAGRAPVRATGPYPVASISPRLEAPVPAFTDWLGSGTLRPETGQGAMYQSEGLLQRVDYGADEDRLALRLVAAAPLRDITIKVTHQSTDENVVTVALSVDARGRVTSDTGDIRVRHRGPLEISIPLIALGLKAGGNTLLQIAIERDGHEVERLPRTGPLAWQLPDAHFRARHWMA